MTTLYTPRERFNRIMNHQEADHVPLDLAGTSLTSADPQVIAALQETLGFEGESDSPYKGFDERILQALDIDFRRVGSLIASGDAGMPGHPGYQQDMWGIVRKWTGQYWDIVESPLRDTTIADIDSYPWPDPSRIVAAAPLADYQREAERLWHQTDYVVVAEHPVYGVLELACWMCGFDDFLARLAGDRPYVYRLFDKLLELQKAFIEPYYKALGPFIHLTTSGDDFGTQAGPFRSPRTFRETVKPYMTERIAFTRQYTQGYFWHHTCGSVYSLLPDLLDSGIDILNPVQPGAKDMEPEHLKRAFGDRLCFHGGFDTQGVLPFGDTETIETEVKRVMDALKPNGGYIFSAAHNIQNDVSAANVLTMYRAARRLGTYSPGKDV